MSTGLSRTHGAPSGVKTVFLNSVLIVKVKLKSLELVRSTPMSSGPLFESENKFKKITRILR